MAGRIMVCFIVYHLTPVLTRCPSNRIRADAQTDMVTLHPRATCPATSHQRVSGSGSRRCNNRVKASWVGAAGWRGCTRGAAIRNGMYASSVYRAAFMRLCYPALASFLNCVSPKRNIALK